MKKRIFLSVVLSLAVLFSSCFALQDGAVRHLFETGSALLFNTDNVTVTGHADFFLDGSRFKTADIVYKQSGYDSYWQLDLLTPRPYRSDRETGYTIIANNEKVYVMERYRPGTYSDGYNAPNNTLVRRSVKSDLLVSTALAVADQLELLLPADAFLVSDLESGREIRVRLTGDTTPALLNSAVAMGADFALSRFLGLDSDLISEQTRGRFADYSSVTQGILFTTTGFTLGGTDILVRIDDKGLLSYIGGTVTALLTSAESANVPLEIRFELNISDYGSTLVSLFNPEVFHVVPAGYAGTDRSVDAAQAERFVSRAREILTAAGYSTDALSAPEVSAHDGLYYVSFPGAGDFDVLSVTMNDEGAMLSLADGSELWYMADPHASPVSSLTQEQAAFISALLQKSFPALSEQCSELIPFMEYKWEGSSWLYVSPADAAGNVLSDIYFVLRADGPMKIVNYNCLP